MYWADTIGAAKLLEMIKPLEPLGASFSADTALEGDGGEWEEVLSVEIVICHWSLLRSLVIGHWSLVIGHWSLVIGHWSLVIGHW